MDTLLKDNSLHSLHQNARINLARGMRAAAAALPASSRMAAVRNLIKLDDPSGKRLIFLAML